MSRPARSDGKHPVYLYVCKGYRYASTQPMTIDPTTGKKKLTRILWGNVSESLVLTPNKTFMLADTATRASLVFPSDWDISAVKDLPPSHSPGSERTATPLRGRPSLHHTPQWGRHARDHNHEAQPLLRSGAKRFRYHAGRHRHYFPGA